MTPALPVPSTLVISGFHALSDPLRLQVLDVLRDQEMCVCDLSDSLAVGQSKLSFHLKVLKEAELIRGRQEGRWMYYSLHLARFLELEQYISEFRRYSAILPAKACEE